MTAKSRKPFTADISISKKNVFITSSCAQTRKLGAAFASLLKIGDIVFLNGDLGSGKTTFTQGAVKAFGNKGFARSSSFMLVNEYNAFGGAKLFHIDLYRLEPSYIEDTGLEEYVDGKNITLIEWPQRLKRCASIKTWDINLQYLDEEKRKITIEKSK
ncbi:MAG: tRNA (adenosine(37)-N6)-threonylcarbamoyltransferase complex ATPase subunit type 1 TsaE [Endomicrobium sp.]|jgi:tRNA threonylcarbamoyladenosine biosynthesis protein TsaE|nr:tRNA (adenosine(37)-N6)-threonylcarbamoyltransferase complex ATPase subunit type 1 TsaE [Endomicrobium sp.]